ncbi:MAG: hypothetical protein PHI18_07210 [bacterium]|nr:hypothetical protein [bacterium]
MRVYLDCCAWLDMLRRKATDDDRSALTAAVRGNSISVYVSVETLEEFLPEWEHDRDRFERDARFICECVGNNAITPYDLRMAQEVAYGRALEEHECFFPQFGAQGLLGYLLEDNHADVLKRIQVRKTQMAETNQESYDKAQGHMRDNATLSEAEQYLQEKPRRIPEETAEYFIRFWLQALGRVSCRALPTNWAYFAFEIARQSLRLEPNLGKKQRRSLDESSYDQIAFADAFALGCHSLVTDDGNLAKIVRMIAQHDDRAPEIESFDEFLMALRASRVSKHTAV